MRAFIALVVVALAYALTGCASGQPRQFTPADGANTGPAFGNTPACIKRLPGDCK